MITPIDRLCISLCVLFMSYLNMEYTMYDTLLQLPLFQGLSKAELSEVIEKVKFHFQRFRNEEIILKQGGICNQLIFLLDGEMTFETTAPVAPLVLEEILIGPSIVEIHSLFGKRPCYKATYRARGEVSILTIDKQYLYGVLDQYEVIRMNLFNLLSNKAEQMFETIWNISSQKLEGRIVYLMGSLCCIPRGEKILRIKMEDLAQLLDDTRLNVSRVLNKWQERGLVEMRRKEFIFHDIGQLRAVLEEDV